MEVGFVGVVNRIRNVFKQFGTGQILVRLALWRRSDAFVTKQFRFYELPF
jgi:hypothetical protein